MNNWLLFPVRDLSGGTNLASNDFIHGADELGLIVNWDLTKIGSITKVFGYSSYGESVIHANNTLGLANFYYTNNQKLLLGLDLAIESSASNSPSTSPSASWSPSPSPSLSPSPSSSLSPSASRSPSKSPSISPSASLSPSSSESPSQSRSPSLSPSASASPSAPDDNRAEIYVFDSGTNTWVSQYQDLTSGYKMEFATFLDGIFEVNYADATRYYNGTSWSQTVNVTSAPKAKYVISYNDRLYLAYLDITGTTHKTRVLASSLPDTSYNITWDTSSAGPYFDVSPLDGDDITGLGKNFNRLLIFKEKGLWRYDTNSLYQFPGAPGTNNNRTIQNVLEWTLYLHSTGVYGLKDNAVMNVSRAIKPIIDGIQSVNLDRVCSYTIGDHYYLFLHDVINTEERINIPNCLVDLDVARMRWTVGSLGHTPRIFTTFKNNRAEENYDSASTNYDDADKTYDGYSSASDLTYFGDASGDVYQIDTSYTFNGQTINSYFETPNYYIAGIQARAELQALKIYTVKGHRCKFFYSVDGGPWKPIVKYEYRDGEIYYTFESGVVINHIKLKGIDNSTGDRPSIKGFDFFYSESHEI